MQDEFDLDWIDDAGWAQSAMRQIIAEHFEAGCPIVYEDADFPGEVVEEHPDGQRWIIKRGDSFEKIYVRRIESVTR